jgi:UDP-3-O-[3-hydroxymyristoyl] N-acetylglucosamine deacetylase
LVRQTTLASPANLTGVGLHSGRPATLTARAAAPGTGIVFVRTDEGRRDPPVPARLEGVVSTVLCTTLGADGARPVGTVEHLMAAFMALGIDNATVEVDGPEIPAMDGSALPFVAMIDRAGTLTLDAPRRVIRVLKPVKVGKGEKWATLAPAERLEVGVEIVYDTAPILRQAASFPITAEVFRRDIAPARTYGFMEDIATLHAQGLALGGSLENAVVVGGGTVLNPEGLRFADEFARHKVLDAIGDLGLVGAPVVGRFRGHGSGHALNVELVRALIADASAHAIETVAIEEQSRAWPRAEAATG